GFVSYSIQPKAGIPDGTQIVQAGTVYFDGVSLDTPTFINTTDLLTPTSKVTALTPKENADFTVNWSGDDHNGSGIASYDVYLSVDGNAFTKWQSATTDAHADIAGASANQTFAFYVVSIVNLGPAESKSAADERS